MFKDNAFQTRTATLLGLGRWIPANASRSSEHSVKAVKEGMWNVHHQSLCDEIRAYHFWGVSVLTSSPFQFLVKAYWPIIQHRRGASCARCYARSLEDIVGTEGLHGGGMHGCIRDMYGGDWGGMHGVHGKHAWLIYINKINRYTQTSRCMGIINIDAWVTQMQWHGGGWGYASGCMGGMHGVNKGHAWGWLINMHVSWKEPHMGVCEVNRGCMGGMYGCIRDMYICHDDDVLMNMSPWRSTLGYPLVDVLMRMSWWGCPHEDT